jgi:hypothetical protein
MKENERGKQYIGQATRRRDQFIQERIHDPYKARAKDDGPAECPQCLAVYDDGRWRWTANRSKEGAEKELCPACHRINDNYPAGEIHIGGAFAMAHFQEIENLIHNCQARETQEHPLSRVMAIRADTDEMIVTTTDIHLPRVIANALERAFKGQATFHYDLEGYFARVHWSREDKR